MAGDQREPRRPSSSSLYAVACLTAIADAGLGQAISIGGAFGLAHYHEYRETHDVDAWWGPDVTTEQREAVVKVIEQALPSVADGAGTRTRRWGDVVSIELLGAGPSFSFQIAERSAQLLASKPGIWPGGIGVDSLDDLIASKMLALVDRGAPRDFRDIHELCSLGFATSGACWELWQRGRRLADLDTDVASARLAVRSHLARIERARPLDQIDNAEQRDTAARIRRWFSDEMASP